MSGTALKRKRRVYRNGCANPLFVKWVEEWRDDARERGINSHYSYSKALSSLKKYPLPLANGLEARILDHVGEKLAKMLDKKLAEHHANQGTSNSDNDTASPEVEEGEVLTCKSPHKSKKADRRGISEVPPSSKEARDTEPPLKKKKSVKKRQSCSQEYVPVFRSGPYAILVALYKAEEKPSWKGYLSKSQLITEAQPYCDTSFTVADAGSYYTAWSSASSLTNKGLIVRKGHPPRFSLSDSGASMAARLLQQTEATENSSQHFPSTSSRHPSTHQSSSQVVTTSQPSTRKRQSSGSASSSLLSPAKKCCSLLQESDDEPIPSVKSVNLPGVQAQRQCIVLESEDEGDRLWSTDVNVAHSLEDNTDDSVEEDSNLPPIVFNPLPFWYINPDGRQVLSKNQAAVTIDDKMSVGFLIKCNKNLLESSGLKYCIDHTRQSEGPYVIAYLNNEDAPSVSNPPSQVLSSDSIPETPMIERSKAVSKTSLCTASPIEDQHTVRHVGSAVDPINLTDVDSSDNDESVTIPLTNEVTVDPVNSLTPSQAAGAAALKRLAARGSTSKPTSAGPPSNLDSGGGCRKNNNISTGTIGNQPRREFWMKQAPPSIVSASDSSSQPNSSHQSTTMDLSSELSSPLFVLRPGEFEVILCVDNSESTASRKSSTQFRGILLADLGKNGVAFDVRRLNVGDFTWIAREKASPVPGQLGLPTSCEVVLEHIVERKRIDDLAGSIVDGRFAEQKFRLHNCGIRYPVYLIEEYGDSGHLKIPLRTLVQAVINTQVVDGFQVKTTADIRESVAYLTVMTRALQKYYANKIIKAYAPEFISELNRNSLLRQGLDCTSNVVHTMPFRQFNETSIKNKALSVYEMFARHLFQLPGFSAEKAAAVLEIYPTPAHLHEAYQNCSNESQRESMLSDIRAGQNARRLGIASSRLVCAMYWKGKE